MNRGFTLIELMIVIAIMGIIVAIAVPVYEEKMCEGVQSQECKQVRAKASARREASVLPEPTPSTQCQHGVLFDPAGRQVIGPTGNGISCN